MRSKTAAAVLISGLLLATPSCGPDLFLSALSLEIAPNPAEPGDQVVISFRMTVVPQQEYNVTAYLDGEPIKSEPGIEAYDGDYLMQLGDAGDLIDAHGIGVHVVYAEVRLLERDRAARTGETGFELRAATP